MTEAEANGVTECACQGTGKLEWSDTTIHPNGASASSSRGSRLCPCRLAVEPRAGEAQWWTQEVIYSASVPVPIGNETVEITVKAEVPVSSENYRLVRKGNRYYPTTVDLECGDVTLFPDDARLLAQRLIEAANAADGIDLADVDPCGHWTPCACGHKGQA